MPTIGRNIVTIIMDKEHCHITSSGKGLRRLAFKPGPEPPHVSYTVGRFCSCRVSILLDLVFTINLNPSDPDFPTIVGRQLNQLTVYFYIVLSVVKNPLATLYDEKALEQEIHIM